MSTWSDTVSGLSPLNWWRLGESSGNYADSGSGGNASTSVGSAITRGSTSLVPNDTANLAATSASNNVNSKIAFGNIVNLSGSYTLMVAFSISDSTYTTGYRRLMAKAVASDGFDFGLLKSSDIPANALFHSHYGAAGGFWQPKSAALSANTTYLAFVVYSDAADTLKIFVNGAQSGSTVTSVTENIKSSTNNFNIGIDSPGNASTSFGGVIDEAAVWTSVIADADLTRLWSAFNAKLTSSQQSVSRQAVSRAATR